MNYIVGIVVVAAGVMVGFSIKDINLALQWIVSALYGGYVISNVLKWHWWRFNATGFFWGMLTGIRYLNDILINNPTQRIVKLDSGIVCPITCRFCYRILCLTPNGYGGIKIILCQRTPLGFLGAG